MRRLTINQALVLAVCVALLPVAAFSIIQGLVARQHTQSLIAERLISSVLVTAASQRDAVTMTEHLLGILARDPAVLSMGSRCSDVLANAIAGQDTVINVIRSDESGAVRCSVLPFQAGTTFIDQDWWKSGKLRRDFGLSAPTVGQVSGKRVIVAIKPIFDKSGRFDGMVTAAIPISWIERALDRTRLSGNAIAALADKDGRILVSTTAIPFSRVNLEASFSRSASLSDRDNDRWLYSSAPIFRRDLHVVYAEPRGALTGFARDQLRANFLLPLLALAFTSLAVWIGVHRLVVRWLRRLGALAGQFAAGNYAGDRERFSAAPKEISEFSDNLHGMADAIAHRNAELEKAAIETRAMAREVNHRVKNNLQMILGLLGLQSSRLPESEARLVLDQTRARIAALGLVQRLAYDTGTRAEQGLVDMQTLLGELCQQVRSDFSGRRDIVLDCKAEPLEEHVDRAIPLALIVLETIANAFRHAFPDGRPGTIHVVLEEIEGERILSVTDNGAGFDPAQPAANRMGRDLMAGLARQLDAEMAIDTAPGKGMKVTVRYLASGR